MRGELGSLRGSNTTLAVVATNAKLTKVQANKLAQFASLGMARTIYPVNTMADGDTAFALSDWRPRGGYQHAGRGGGGRAGQGYRARGEVREDAGGRAGAGVGDPRVTSGFVVLSANVRQICATLSALPFRS